MEGKILFKKPKEHIDEDPEKVQKDIDNIRNWLMKQPHLKARTDDRTLMGFLRCCKYSLERTKEKIDNFLTYKTVVPEFFSLCNPKEKKIQELLKLGVFVPLLTPKEVDFPRIILIRSAIHDPAKVKLADFISLINLVNFVLLMEDDYVTMNGVAHINDMRNSSMSTFAEATPPNLKKIAKGLQESLPFSYKGCHLVNPPPYAETAIKIFKMFIKDKIKERIRVHSNIDDLYNYVSKSILPSEYGGDAGPLQDLIDYWKVKVESYSDMLLEEAQYKSDESKRIGSPKTVESLFGMDGSFRQLQID